MLNFTLIHFRNSNCKDAKRNVQYFKFQQSPNGIKVEGYRIDGLNPFYACAVSECGKIGIALGTFFSVFLDDASNTVEGLSPRRECIWKKGCAASCSCVLYSRKEIWNPMPNLFFGPGDATSDGLARSHTFLASAHTFPTLCLLCGFGLCNNSWKKKSFFLNSLSSLIKPWIFPSFLCF